MYIYQISLGICKKI